jgi:hypothetical protein
VRATKQVIMRSLDVPSLETAIQNLDDPAFAEKRTPNWVGRQGETFAFLSQPGLDDRPALAAFGRNEFTE